MAVGDVVASEGIQLATVVDGVGHQSVIAGSAPAEEVDPSGIGGVGQVVAFTHYVILVVGETPGAGGGLILQVAFGKDHSYFVTNTIARIDGSFCGV